MESLRVKVSLLIVVLRIASLNVALTHESTRTFRDLLAGITLTTVVIWWEVGSFADTTNALREGRLSSLYNVLSDQGFEVVKEEIDVFTFIEAQKIDNKH
jgi:hypothetical protein